MTQLFALQLYGVGSRGFYAGQVLAFSNGLEAKSVLDRLEFSL